MTDAIHSNGHSQIDVAATAPMSTEDVKITHDLPRGDPYAVGKRRVAILGFAPSSLKVAIETILVDPSWVAQNQDAPSEIWGINELYKVPGITRAERWFDIHDRRDGDISRRDPQNIQFLKTATIPIFMQDHYDDIPSSVRFPREAVVRHFRTNYFTNSISYEIALAIMEGRDERGFVIDPMAAFGEIHVYGVDMAQDAKVYSEYQHQRPSVEYFLAWARAIGIKTYIPPESDLLKTLFMYGYEGDTSSAFKSKLTARRGELQVQVDQLRGEANKLIAQAQQHQFRAAGLEGALEDTHYIERCWAVETNEAFTITPAGEMLSFDRTVVRPAPAAPSTAAVAEPAKVEVPA